MRGEWTTIKMGSRRDVRATVMAGIAFPAGRAGSVELCVPAQLSGAAAHGECPGPPGGRLRQDGRTAFRCWFKQPTVAGARPRHGHRHFGRHHLGHLLRVGRTTELGTAMAMTGGSDRLRLRWVQEDRTPKRRVAPCLRRFTKTVRTPRAREHTLVQDCLRTPGDISR
jgi:hypothetical protein